MSRTVGSKTPKSRWRHVGRLFGGAALAIGLASASGWGYDDAQPAAPAAGLTGILPAQVPDGLTVDDFAVLDGAWAEWSQGTADAVTALYEGENQDAATQRAALANLRVKLGTMKKALNDSSYRMIAAPLSDLYGKLVRRVDVAEALLNTLELDPEQAKAVRLADAYRGLSQSVAALKSDLRSIPGGSSWLGYVRADELTNASAGNDASAETLEVLKGIHAKIAGRGNLADEAQRAFLGRESFVGIEQSIADVIAASEFAPGEDYQAQLRDGFARFVTAVEAYEAAPGRSTSADVRATYTAIRELALDGGAQLSDVMREDYFNFNLRVTVAEGMLQRLIGDARIESGWINESTSDAYVSGWQCTNANVSVDLLPATDRARFNIQLNATIQTNANAYASQATVQVVGTHYAYATKEVSFDGHNFATGPVSANANANLAAVDAQTKYSGIPLLGGFADRIALREARSRTAATQYSTASRIAGEVGGRLSSEVDDQFANASMEIENKVYGPLREEGLYPDAISLSSTSSTILWRSRLMDSGELGGGLPGAHVVVPSNGMVVEIHESLLNNGADRLNFAGRTMTEDEVKAELEAKIEKILGREVSLDDDPAAGSEYAPDPAAPADAPAPEAAPAAAPEGEKPAVEEVPAPNGGVTLVFDDSDPIRLVAEDGTLTLVLRAGLKREGQDDIPTQIIEVPLTFTVQGTKILVERGNVGVKPVDRPPSPAEQIARAGVMRQNIERALPNREVDGVIDFEVQEKKLNVTVTNIEAQDGWLTITAR